MNEEQLKQLIAESFSTLKTELLEEVDRKNQGLAANLSKKIKSVEPSEPQETEQSLTQKTLEQRINELEETLAEKEKQAFIANRNSKIADLISKSDVQAKGILSRQIQALYGDKLVTEDGKWFIQNGENIKDFDSEFSEYLETEEGKFFRKPSSTKGANSKTTTNVLTPEIPNKDQQILAAFNDI